MVTKEGDVRTLGWSNGAWGVSRWLAFPETQIRGARQESTRQNILRMEDASDGFVIVVKPRFFTEPRLPYL